MISLITKFKKVTIFRYTFSDFLISHRAVVLLDLLADRIWGETCKTEVKNL
jgi:hypothetical protein